MLKLYNTLTREKEEFKPLNPPFVGMYVCGPTVYDHPHLGHAKSYISFDVINRFLRALQYNVRYVQNITDVGHLLGDNGDGEDRIEKKARLEKLEPVEIAQKYEKIYFKDMDSLNCLRPDISSRATGHILEMIEMIKILIEKGHAYEVDGNVYYDLESFPDYGKLSGRKLEDMKSGTRIQTADDKRNRYDFALWKKADENHLMQWPSPWGVGFPGWHLECSVMSMKYIGETLDIHGGGLDNQFPHHECEIAQSEAVTGKKFVNYWLHNNMVTVDGQKMSKSLGNFITLSELFDKYDPMTIRFFVLQGHYRSPQDFSDEALKAAQKGYLRLSRAVSLVRSGNQERDEYPQKWQQYKDKFYKYMNDDFNTAGAITVLFDLVKEVNLLSNGSGRNREFQFIDRLFSELGEHILGLEFQSNKHLQEDDKLAGNLIDILVNMRSVAKEEKNWAAADEIRSRLSAAGIILEDGKEGTKWTKSK